MSPRENCSRLLVFEKVIEIQKTIKPLQFLFTCIVMLANLNNFFSKTSKRLQFFACELHFGCQSTFQGLRVNKNCIGFIGFENAIEIQKTIKPLQFLFTCILMLANLNKFFSKTSKRPQFFACELHFGCQSTFQSLQVNKNCSGFIGFENVVASTI